MSIKQRKTLGKPHNIFYYVFITHACTHTPLSLYLSQEGRSPSSSTPLMEDARASCPFLHPVGPSKHQQTQPPQPKKPPYKLPQLQSLSRAPGTSHAGKHISCLVTPRRDMEVPGFQVSILPRSHTQPHSLSPASPQEPGHRGEQPACPLSGLGPASAQPSAIPCVGKGASPAGALPSQPRTPHSPPPHWE